MVGDWGAAVAVAAWTVIALLWALAFFLGAFIVPVVLAVTVIAVILTMRVSSGWRAGRIVMVSALALWVVCSFTFWWLWGVGFDAADSFKPEPAIMVLYDPSLMVGSVAFVVFVLTLGMGVVRRKVTTGSASIRA